MRRTSAVFSARRARRSITRIRVTMCPAAQYQEQSFRKVSRRLLAELLMNALGVYNRDVSMAASLNRELHR